MLFRAAGILLFASLSGSLIGCADSGGPATKDGTKEATKEAGMTGSVDATIDYVEFPATDMAATKAFYTNVFGWSFTDYGPDYASFAKAEAGRDGGFTTQTPMGGSPAEVGGVLIVLYAEDLEAMQAKIEAAGGKIVQPIFSFPGGRRFHFTDPSGNELAVWGEGEEG